MKVWEKINEIKNSNVSCDDMYKWMVLNKICPLTVSTELEEGKQLLLDKVAEKHCQSMPPRSCYPDCWKQFLLRDMESAHTKEQP